jgi:hypothetical protein
MCGVFFIYWWFAEWKMTLVVIQMLNYFIILPLYRFIILTKRFWTNFSCNDLFRQKRVWTIFLYKDLLHLSKHNLMMLSMTYKNTLSPIASEKVAKCSLMIYFISTKKVWTNFYSYFHLQRSISFEQKQFDDVVNLWQLCQEKVVWKLDMFVTKCCF